MPSVYDWGHIFFSLSIALKPCSHSLLIFLSRLSQRVQLGRHNQRQRRLIFQLEVIGNEDTLAWFNSIFMHS